MRRTIKEINQSIDNLIDKSSDKIGGFIRYSGGIWNNGSHFIDLLVSKFGKIVNFSVIRSKSFSKNSDKNVDFILEFNRGRFYFLCCDFFLNDLSIVFHEIDLFSNKRRLILTDAGNKISKYEVCNNSIFTNTKYFKKNLSKRTSMNVFQKCVLDDIYVFFKSGNSNLPSGFETIETMEIIDKLTNISS